ncbi:MAG TPA: peptidoglycan-binding domain-containing protein [Candidatus Paceibacterota bacterium]|nr:peptidoglycan-binding domain-containing protein [Candidatus Paceibacterota bacterium]
MDARSLPFLLLAVVVIAGLVSMFMVQDFTQTAIVGVAQEDPTCISLSNTLFFGATDAKTNGEVSKLQKLLARDSKIYPEGTVSGYFGPKTANAVKKWQKSKGISQTGVVGPLTRASFACKATSPEASVPPAASSQNTPATSVVSNAPTCTLTTDKNEYIFKDKVVITWSTTNATHVTFPEMRTGDLQFPAYGTYAAQGYLEVTANVSGESYILLVAYGGEGSVSCKKTITVRK